MNITKPFLLALFLLNTAIGFAQQVAIKTATGEGIPYATITFLKQDSIVGGMYANEKGLAMIAPDMDIDVLLISHLGFGTQKVTWEHSNIDVVLEELLNDLPEVVITQRKEEAVWMGHEFVRKRSAFCSAQRGMEIVTFVQNNKQLSNLEMTAFKFKVRRRSEDKTAVLKINFYTNESNTPGKRINAYQDITVALAKGERGDVVLDLKTYHMIFPEEGVFVGIEWMGFADDEGTLLQNNTYNDSSIAYSACSTEQLTFMRSAFGTDKWSRMTFWDGRKDTFVPAFSIEVK
ncbi:hypothetical protein [Mangrovimonas sp. TPBH4]|uniref:hypothetical protein n=1 Tax=Mangrovimonas sp. TPBH4 TaxID=1645914 RepID=UPI0006B6423A|nr:hypothetical protein [Mangrovimonas sp. TPBH4]